MRSLSLFRKLALTGVMMLVCSAATCSERLSEEEQANDQLCNEMGASLRADIRVAAATPVGGGRINIDRLNDITEQRLVAMRAMVFDCRLWARGRMSTDALADRMLRHSGVLTAPESSEVSTRDLINGRLDRLENNLSRIADRRGTAADAVRENRDAAVHEAERLAGDPSLMQAQNDQLINDIAAQLRPAMRQMALEEYAAARSEAEFEARLASVQNRLADVEGSLRGLHYYQVFFATSSAEISVDGLRYLDALAIEPLVNARSIRVIGYADERGAQDGNLHLSTERARAVESYLEGRGIVVESAVGAGETVSFGDSGSPIDDQAANRRVIIEAVR